MAARQAPQDQDGAAPCAIAANRLRSVDAAARIKAAVPSDERRQSQTVTFDEKKERLRDHFCRRFRSRPIRARYSASTSRRDKPFISAFGSNTRSSPRRASFLLRRKQSRSRRFVRFRSTAPPTRRLAASPIRQASKPFSAAISVNSRPSSRNPLRKVLWKSAGLFSRSWDVSRWLASPGPWLCGDAPTPFLPAPLQNEPPAFGAHAYEEAVCPLPLPVVRLKGPLHDSDSDSDGPARAYL
jgi:hypothetical protein